MKTNIKHAMWLLTLAATSIFVACSDGDDPEVVVDKTALNATIQEATDLLANSQEGTAEG